MSGKLFAYSCVSRAKYTLHGVGFTIDHYALDVDTAPTTLRKLKYDSRSLQRMRTGHDRASNSEALEIAHVSPAAVRYIGEPLAGHA